MDIDLTSEQELLRESVRRVCARHAGLDVVRAMESDPIGYPPPLWSALGELGLLGLTLPERWGGAGMSMVDAAIVYQELGRALAPTPHFVSCVLAAGVLARAGSARQQDRWLPRVASGEAILSAAWLEPDRGFGPEGVQLGVRPDGADVVLDGVKWHVPFAGAADRILVLGRAAEHLALVLVDPRAPGVELAAQPTIAADSQYRLRLDQVRVPAEDVVVQGAAAWQTWTDVLYDGAILLAAQAVGGARQALALAVDYAKTRQQFDKPLGAFQALAHDLADATTAVDGAETLQWEAAWTRDDGRDVRLLAPMAKLFATQTFRDVTATAQQIFGGVGFTLDFDIQLYFRRAKALQLGWWDGTYLEELVAAQLLDA